MSRSMGGSIKSGLSSQILIKVGNSLVGAIQDFSVTQDRDMIYVEEIGTDGIVEIYPKNAAKISLSIQRLVFDNLRLPEALGRGYVNLQSQRIPFDILVIDRSKVKEESGVIERNVNRIFGTDFSTGAITRGLSDFTGALGTLGINVRATEPYVGHAVHIYNNCFIKQYVTKYVSSDFTIMETANVVCEYVTSMVSGKNIATGGSQGIQYDYDSIERVTDLTGNKGRFYAVFDDRRFGKKLLDALF